MPILIDSNWYALNETRSYPLDDAATARDDAGNPLPTDLLVDCALRFPDSFGVTAYLAAATASAGVVTVVFQGSPNVANPSQLDWASAQPETGIPLAAVTIPQPVTPYLAYALTPLSQGVSGWVAFGRGAAYPYSGRFSTPSQGAILPRCAAGYPQPPVSGLGKFLLPPLTDLATLAAGSDIAAYAQPITIESLPVPAVVFELAQALAVDVFQEYSGPCAGRPESNSCGLPDILQISGVAPDPGAGNINISFPGATAYPMPGGIALSVPTPLEAICPPTGLPDPETGVLTGQGTSACGDDVFFGATPPAGFSIIFGVFYSSASGYQCIGSEACLSVVSRDPPPTMLTLSMTLQLGDYGLNGGIAFGFDGTGSYCVALVDGFAGTLSLCTVKDNTTLSSVATKVLEAAIPPRSIYPWSVQTVQMTLTLGPSPTPGLTHATCQLVALAGYAVVSGDMKVADGQYGVVSYGGITTFLELKAS